MGDILTTLTSTGSKYTYSAVNGAPQPYPEDFIPPINILSTKDSTLHFNPNSKINNLGYSTIGTEMNNYPEFLQSWISSTPGNKKPLPEPSTIELTDPIGADANNKPKYDYIKGNRYQDQNFK